MHNGSMQTTSLCAHIQDQLRFDSLRTSSSGSKKKTGRVDSIHVGHKLETPIPPSPSPPMHLPIALALLSVLTFSPAISAQSHSVLPRTTTLPASTRAMALGDSYVLNSGKADVLFYHPALLARATGFGGSLQRWGSASSAASRKLHQLLGLARISRGLRALETHMRPRQKRLKYAERQTTKDTLYVEG